MSFFGNTARHKETWWNEKVKRDVKKKRIYFKDDTKQHCGMESDTIVQICTEKLSKIPEEQ